MKQISIFDYCGPFCTSRQTKGLSELQKNLSEALTKGKDICFLRTGVKIMSASFIDELVCTFITSFSEEHIQSHISFSPPLENIYLEQIKRGFRLR